MAASVEVRVPYIDPVAARAAFFINGSGKARHGQRKVALKRALEGWLPREIVHRPKDFLQRPPPGLCVRQRREVINDVLVGGELAGSGMIRGAVLRSLIRDEQARPK